MSTNYRRVELHSRPWYDARTDLVWRHACWCRCAVQVETAVNDKGIRYWYLHTMHDDTNPFIARGIEGETP